MDMCIYVSYIHISMRHEAISLRQRAEMPFLNFRLMLCKVKINSASLRLIQRGYVTLIKYIMVVHAAFGNLYRLLR